MGVGSAEAVTGESASVVGVNPPLHGVKVESYSSALNNSFFNFTNKYIYILRLHFTPSLNN